MRPLAFLFCSAALVAGSAQPSMAAAPIRHLVYNFTVGIHSSTSVHDEGTGASRDYSGGNGDEGTITVDVTGASGDGGLVVSVSENARNTRSAKPVTCVVYGVNLSTICADFVNDEELAVVRLTGRNFVSPEMESPKSHWVVPGSVPEGTDTNDFTVTGNQNGVLTITEVRVEKVRGANSYDATTNGTIAYDASKTVPTAIHEQLVRRDVAGPHGQNTMSTFTDLTLVTDSLGAKP